MRIHILLLAACSLAAVEVAIPVTVLGEDAHTITVGDAGVPVSGATIPIVVGVPTTLAWKVGDRAVTQVVIAVDKSSADQAPAWHNEQGAVLVGGDRLSVAMQRARLQARTEAMRARAGGAGQVSGTITGSQIEMVVTMAADAADQPPYAVAPGPPEHVRQIVHSWGSP